MRKLSNLVLVMALSLFCACSGSENGAAGKLKASQDAVQEKADAFIQPRIQAIEKAKGLEDRLNKMEEKRLNDIEAFEGVGQ